VKAVAGGVRRAIASIREATRPVAPALGLVVDLARPRGSLTWSLAAVSDGPGQPRVNAGQVYCTTRADCTRLPTTNKDVNAPLEYEVVVQGFRHAQVYAVTETHVLLIGADGVYKVAR